jgi:ESF2/ABP1 family protein
MEAESKATKQKKKVLKPLSKKRLQRHLEDAENRGVCYFSRLPPFMKPDKLRNLLSGMGTEVLRVYLVAESTAVRAGRVRAGGNKKKNYTEGWVEFENKRRAKRIASSLNNTPIGGGNRAFFAHDLWNIKYLHKFKWSHLTEKIAYEARVKRDKMQAELSAAKKESAFYLRKVDQAKAINAMEERKRKRADAVPAQEGGEVARAATAEDAIQSVRRKFKQRRVATDPTSRAAPEGLLGSLLPTRRGGIPDKEED